VQADQWYLQQKKLKREEEERPKLGSRLGSQFTRSERERKKEREIKKIINLIKTGKT